MTLSVGGRLVSMPFLHSLQVPTELSLQIHESLFPTLAKMARDILPIPATSVSVERLFSRSRGICTDLRSSLKAETVREALLTKVWIKTDFFDLILPPQRRVQHGSVELLPK